VVVGRDKSLVSAEKENGSTRLEPNRRGSFFIIWVHRFISPHTSSRMDSYTLSTGMRGKAMSLKEYVTQELDRLDETKLQQVADYLDFLRFQSRPKIQRLSDTELAALYAEFAEEDRQMAEEGMEDYALALAAEDKR
jgi:hypothetical protein